MNLKASEVQEILLDEFGLIFEIDENLNYQVIDNLFEDEGFHLIYSKHKLKEIDIDVLSDGIEFVRVGTKSKHILPSIIQILKNVPSFELKNQKIITKISRGFKISITEFEKYNNQYLIVTSHNLPVAFGTVLDGKLVPIADIGWYLREGN